MNTIHCSKQDKNEYSVGLEKRDEIEKERLISFMKEGERGRETDRTQKDQK